VACTVFFKGKTELIDPPPERAERRRRRERLEEAVYEAAHPEGALPDAGWDGGDGTGTEGR